MTITWKQTNFGRSPERYATAVRSIAMYRTFCFKEKFVSMATYYSEWRKATRPQSLNRMKEAWVHMKVHTNSRPANVCVLSVGWLACDGEECPWRVTATDTNSAHRFLRSSSLGQAIGRVKAYLATNKNNVLIAH